jgi:Integrase core domain
MVGHLRLVSCTMGFVLGVVRHATWLSLLFAPSFGLALLTEIAGGLAEWTRNPVRRRLRLAVSVVVGMAILATVAVRDGSNGKAERFIQTALREWAYARAYHNSDQRSAELLHWLHRYNWHRPHGSLKANTPISRLGLSEDNVLRLHS